MWVHKNMDMPHSHAHSGLSRTCIHHMCVHINADMPHSHARTYTTRGVHIINTDMPHSHTRTQDHNVSSKMAQLPEFRLGKPPAYHYDLFLLALITLACGLLGIPPINGVLPQAPMHSRSLLVIGGEEPCALDRYGFVSYCLLRCM